jgi:hypothetical protein
VKKLELERENVEDAAVDNFVGGSGIRVPYSGSEHTHYDIGKFLLKVPLPSFGWLKYSLPTFFAVLAFPVLPVFIIFGYVVASVYLLCLIPFPMNYLAFASIVAPLLLISSSARFQHLFRLYFEPKYGCKVNPHAVEEYIQLLKRKSGKGS